MPRPFSRPLYLSALLLAVGAPALCGAGHGAGTASSGGASRSSHAVPGCDARVHRRTLRRRRHAHREARSEGSQRRGAPRPRDDRPRAVQRRGNLAAGRPRRVRRRARRPSSSASCSRCSVAPRRRPRCRVWPRWPTTSQNAVELARAGPRAAGARSVPGSQRRVSRRDAGWRRTTPPSRRRGAICSSRNTTTPKRSSRTSACPRARSALGAGAARRRARARRRQPAAGRRARSSALLRDQPVLGGRAHLPGEPGRSTSSTAPRRASCWRRRSPINPSSLDAHSALAALAFVEDKHAGVRGRSRQGAGDLRRRTARSTAPPASCSRTTTGSRKRSR